MTERAYERHAWVLIFFVGIVGLIFPVRPLLGSPSDPQEVRSLTGMTFDEVAASQPRITSYVNVVERAFGTALLFFILLGLVLSAFPYRRGEKWAWFTLWTAPVSLLAFTVMNISAGGAVWPLLLVLMILSLVGLLLPIRKFFATKQPEKSVQQVEG